MARESLARSVRDAVDRSPVFDIHTHLYLPSFGLTLWGIDELLTYHYLVAETLRFSPIAPEVFLAMPKREQADVVWDTLFVRHSPISEATTGVVTTLSEFGFDPNARDLREVRAYFDTVAFDEHLDRVLDLSGVRSLVMTNDPFDGREAPLWEAPKRDPRFHAALRIDPLLGGISVGSSGAAAKVPTEIGAIRTFLEGWVAKMRPLYMAASLPPTFAFPEDSHRARVVAEAILPVCKEHGLPFAMMIGVRKRVHPRLGDAGDSLGLADMGAVERLCEAFPDNRFLVSALARENQQGLCVAARKFSNLLPFGCWWFMNNPSLVRETTLLRLELLGASFVPQHSDARVLDQVVYKWKHSRREIADALVTRYEAIERAGRTISDEEIGRDVRALLHDNASAWVIAE